MIAKELYDRDFLEWTRCNAALLRARRFEEADIEHLAEEIEDMGKSQQRELESRLRVLLTHLLKYQARPASGASPSWKATIKVQRFELQRLLEQMPSLRKRLSEEVAAVYGLAVSKAAVGAKLFQGKYRVQESSLNMRIWRTAQDLQSRSNRRFFIQIEDQKNNRIRLLCDDAQVRSEVK